MSVHLPGLIQISLSPRPFEEVERCRANIHTMFENEVFSTKSGKVTLHFDHEGNIQKIEADKILWAKNKPPLTKAPPNEKIEVQLKTTTETISGTPK